MKIDYTKFSNSRMVRTLKSSVRIIERLDADGRKVDAQTIRDLVRSRIASNTECSIANRMLKEALARVAVLEQQAGTTNEGPIT